jgi:hypothetical protein
LIAYYAFSREVSHHAQSAKWQQSLPELLCRQIVHMGLDAKIRLYRYEQWIPAKWAELHALFTLACSRQFERQQLVIGPGGSSTTIEHEFLIVLLVQLMNAGNMTARHLEWVAAELEVWCAQLRLTLEPSSVTSFFIDLGGREGLRRRTPAPLEGRVLFLDTRPLHSMLMQNVLMLEQKIKGQPLSDRTPKRSEQLGLLTKLASQVDPEFKPFARRGERTAAAGTVDAIIGFAKISGYLREEDQMPGTQMEPGKSFGGDDGTRGVRAHAQRPRPPPRARTPPLCDVRSARRPVGSQGCEPDRLSSAGADDRRQCHHARDAGGHPPAWSDTVDTWHRAPDEENDRRPRRDRSAGDRQHADRRRSGRAAQGQRRRLFGGR